MEEFAKGATNFIGAVSLIMALVLMVSLLHRQSMVPRLNTALMGVLFSISLFISMSDPIDLGEAGIHDMRGLLIGSATALINPVAGAMTMLTGLVYRWVLGGPGMYPSFAGMVLAFLGAWAWRVLFKKATFANWKKSVLLGACISVHSCGVLLFPSELWIGLLTTMVPYYILGNLTGALMINHLIGGEVTFLSESENARRLSKTDHLTGLLNRRGLEEAFPPAPSGRSGHRGRALLYFDVDHFKQVNDDHGHKTGDSVLRQIAERITANLRPDDVFARLGGDEFVVVLQNIDLHEANHIAERCRKVVEEDVPEDDIKGLDVSISIGAVWMIDDVEINHLLDQADKALYVAKAGGRNRVVFKPDNAYAQHAVIA